MQQRLVSVVMPVYNAAVHLREAIESVLNQTYRNIELLIMDDGSSDGTAAIARQYQDERIKIFEASTNSGQSVQLNQGIQQAGGDYICIMHADDIMHPLRIERQLEFFKKYPATGICGSFVELIGNSTGTWHYPEKSQACKDLLLRAVPFAHPAVMMRKSALDNVSPVYTPGMTAAEDYDLWVRLAGVTEFGNVQETLLQYRIHETQLSNTKKKEEEAIVEQIRGNLISTVFRFKDNTDAAKCFRAVYHPDEVNLGEYLSYLQIFWQAAHTQSIFSKTAIIQTLKHAVFKKLSSTNFSNRVYNLLKYRFLWQIAGYKTVIRILFFR